MTFLNLFEGCRCTLLIDSGRPCKHQSSPRMRIDAQVQDAASLAVDATMLACCGTSEAGLFSNGTLMRLATISLVGLYQLSSK